MGCMRQKILYNKRIPSVAINENKKIEKKNQTILKNGKKKLVG